MKPDPQIPHACEIAGVLWFGVKGEDPLPLGVSCMPEVSTEEGGHA